ncbi:MAG: hypothetical protein IKM28_07510 [Lachnospiraceae bacterium]|nr:hypothetical protein [Lachnospiraceae bacterium]
MAIGSIGFTPSYSYTGRGTRTQENRTTIWETGSGYCTQTHVADLSGEHAKEEQAWKAGLSWRQGYWLEHMFEKSKVVGENEENITHEEKRVIEKKGTNAPYSYLADENGIIEYKGVIFTCDNQRNRLCLGDVSDPKQVIQIPLSQGGCLVVNRDNIGDLSRAISMFSPEDVNRILRALNLDAKLRQTEKEIEEMEDGIGDSQQSDDHSEVSEEIKTEKENR